MPIALDSSKIGAVGEYIKNNTPDGSFVSVSSPIFTIYAFEELRPILEKSGKFRFLFNEPTFVRNIILNNKEVKEFELKMSNREKNVSEFGLEISLKNNLDQDQIASKCYQFIKNKAEVKSVIKEGVITPNSIFVENNERSYLIMGNNVGFSKDGLGYTNQIRFDFNTVNDEPSVIEQYQNFFDTVFNNEEFVKDVKAELLKHLSNLYRENSPELVYYLTLYNIFGERLLNMDDMARVKEKTGIINTKVWNTLYNFQHDAVVGAIKKLELYNGCIIADSVGLGKTFEALAIIKYYELRNDRVLVLCPKKLRNNWTGFKQNSTTNILANDRFNYDVLNHTDLSRDRGYSGDINLETVNWGNYDLLVIDAYGIIGLNSKDSINKGFSGISPILFSPQKRLTVELRRCHAQIKDFSAKRPAAGMHSSIAGSIIPFCVLQRQSNELSSDVDLHRSSLWNQKDVSLACTA